MDEGDTYVSVILLGAEETQIEDQAEETIRKNEMLTSGW